MACNGTGNCILEQCVSGCSQTCASAGTCTCDTGC
jgi:hypothetical protein